jgi:2-iminobutanoate/2-iminopropanoate deaminase
MKPALAIVSVLAAAPALPQAPSAAKRVAPDAPQAAAPASPSASAATRKQVLVRNTGSAPFSRVVRGGDLVFVAGQLGFKQGTRELVPGGIGPETRAALEAIAANLAQAGLGMDDVVKCDVFLADIAEFQAMNDAYARFFPKDPPARTTVGVAGLSGDARVEIDCVAIMR